MEKKSFEKLASPEQLDRLLVVIRMPGWIALFCLFLIILGIFLWAIFGSLPVTTVGKGIFFDPRAIEIVQSESEGVVKKILVEERKEVEKGTPLILLQTADKEREIAAPADGKIVSYEILPGEVVTFGQTLLWFEKKSGKNQIFSFFSLEEGDQIRPGMPAHIDFFSVRKDIYGKMEGEVKEILHFTADMQGDILKAIPSESLRQYLASDAASVIVIIEPLKDPNAPTGYKWTISEGPPYPVSFGSVADVKIIMEEKKPISYLIPIGGDK